MRIATFNAGLATGVLPHVTERLPHVVAALAALDVDVLFVQEFWLDAHFHELVAALPHLHAFRAPPANPARHGACTAEELAPLAACVEKSCPGLTGEALAQCVIRSCARVALGISPDCLSCITSHPVGSFAEIVAPCIGAEVTTGRHTGTPGPREAGYYAPAGMVAYGGSFGTGLLAKRPLLDRDVLVFEATLNARSALYARIENIENIESADDPRDTHLFATHLSPGIVDEQHAQIDALLAWIEEKTQPTDRTVIVGDLNTGPRIAPHVSAHNRALYQRFLDAGFTNPYTASRCTFCHGSLSSGAHGEGGWLLDHVLLRGFGAARAERVLDRPLTLGRTRTTLSDHCGVLVQC